MPGQVESFVEHMRVRRRAAAHARTQRRQRVQSLHAAPHSCRAGGRCGGGGQPRGAAAVQRWRHARGGGAAERGRVVLVRLERRGLVRRAGRPGAVRARARRHAPSRVTASQRRCRARQLHCRDDEAPSPSAADARTRLFCCCAHRSAFTEEHARDSYENLLFSLCRFHELTGAWCARRDGTWRQISCLHACSSRRAAATHRSRARAPGRAT